MMAWSKSRNMLAVARLSPKLIERLPWEFMGAMAMSMIVNMVKKTMGLNSE